MTLFRGILIPDAFSYLGINGTHKYVVALDNFAIGNDEGIVFIHIADFLLMDRW